ncbi:response regulator transcription factor [Kitasatospora camelliae]|uniref:Response regulator transcription factor n=1 Tax=Kitasatospora camelliae TaxID=3156397 RepID=A0AAU8JWM7_9ACTN
MWSSEASHPEPAPSVDVVLGLRNDLQRFGVERILQSADTVGRLDCVTDATEAITVATAAGADILVLALAELDEPAARSLDTLGAGGPRLLLLIDDEEHVDLDRVTRVRSAGFLGTAQLTARALLDTLARIAAGEVPIPPVLAHRLLAPGRLAAPERPAPRLTPREREALALLVDGLSNKQIGRRMAISDHGAKRLVANILAKLDCPNRTYAVTRALREGLYEPAG